MELRKLESLDLENKKVLLRLDLNVPLKDSRITDDTRIQSALATIEYILERTNKVVLMSHLGRPKGRASEDLSLAPVGERLAELLNKEVLLVSDYLQEPVEQVLNHKNPNQIILLENLRFHEGETKNQREFAQALVQGIDVFVNDAFGTLHRAHSSVVGVPELLPPESRAAGLLVQKEISVLSNVQKNPKSPFVAIVGGAKVSDKIGVTLNLLNHCNDLLVGGAMAYTFLKFLGVNVGKSRVEEDKLHLVESIYKNADARRVKIHLPSDHLAAEEFDSHSKAVLVGSKDIPEHLMGLDIGPNTITSFSRVIANAETILWNGPMGVFEWAEFSEGTLQIAKACSDAKGYSIVGGGDSVAAVNKAGVSQGINHISTGGGASLEYLEGKVLPGVKVLMD